MIFDVFGAAFVFLLVRLQRPHGQLPFLAAAVFFSGPRWLIDGAV